VAINSNDTSAGTPVIKTRASTPSDTRQKFMVNNWLGFLSTCTCPCPDTHDLNNVGIEITFADGKVLFSGAHTTSGAEIDVVAARYELKDVHLTISKIVFNDPLHYNLKTSKLFSSGSTIGYETYMTSRQAEVNKGANMLFILVAILSHISYTVKCECPHNG